MRFRNDVVVFLEWVGILILCCIILFFDMLLKLYRIVSNRVVDYINKKRCRG